MDDEQRERLVLAQEEQVRERLDRSGNLWRKVYVGSGEHLKNWLEQSREIAGENNVHLEKIELEGLPCLGQEGESPFRIWVRFVI